MKDIIKKIGLLFLTLLLFSCDNVVVSHDELIEVNESNKYVPMDCYYYNTDYMVVNITKTTSEPLGDVSTTLLQCSYLVYKKYGVEGYNKLGFRVIQSHGNGYYNFVDKVYFSFNGSKRFYIDGDNFYKLGSMFLTAKKDEDLLMFFNKNLKNMVDKPLFKDSVNTNSFVQVWVK